MKLLWIESNGTPESTALVDQLSNLVVVIQSLSDGYRVMSNVLVDDHRIEVIDSTKVLITNTFDGVFDDRVYIIHNDDAGVWQYSVAFINEPDNWITSFNSYGEAAGFIDSYNLELVS